MSPPTSLKNLKLDVLIPAHSPAIPSRFPGRKADTAHVTVELVHVFSCPCSHWHMPLTSRIASHMASAHRPAATLNCLGSH